MIAPFRFLVVANALSAIESIVFVFPGTKPARAPGKIERTRNAISAAIYALLFPLWDTVSTVNTYISGIYMAQ